MLAPSEEGRDAVSGHHTHDPGSEQTGARVAGLPLKIQNPHAGVVVVHQMADRKSTRLNSSHSQISYAVFCLKKKKYQISNTAFCISDLLTIYTRSRA